MKEKKNDRHYVNNVEFYEELIPWLKECEIAFSNDNPRPQIPTSIAEKIIKVCAGTAQRYNFNSYTFQDEFIADGVENCVRYAHKFDYINYKSPYSYFGRIAWQACVARIEKEDKQWRTKLKYAMNAEIEGVLHELQSQDSSNKYDNEYIKFLQALNDEKGIDLTFEPKTKRKRIKKVDNDLEEYFEEK